MKKDSYIKGLRLLIIGLDGATFDVIKPMIAAGELPHLASLMAEGTHGELQSTVPPISPAAWTSFMTGVNPGQHGILGFLIYNPLRYNVEAKPLTSMSLAGRTFFDLLGEARHRLVVVTVPLTYPAWPINGCMISGPPCSDGGADYVYPPSLDTKLTRRYTFPAVFWATASNDEFFHKGIEMDASRAALVARLIEEEQPTVVTVVLGSTDRAQHAFWRYHDREFGAQLGLPEEKDYSQAIAETYRRADENIGRLLAYAREDTLVLVLSDHGGGPAATKHIHTNVWLRQLGLLKTKRGHDILVSGLRKGLVRIRRRIGARVEKRIRAKLPTRVVEQTRSLTMNVAQINWSSTCAFRFPMNTPAEGIEINVAGRQPNGIVQPGDEYEQVRQHIIEQARELTDPETGSPIVAHAYRREEIYSGAYMELMPDVVLIFHNGYTPGTRTAPPLFTPVSAGTLERTNGHHQIEGIFVAQGKSVKKGQILEGARLIDVAPTLLHALEIPVPTEMDGRVLDIFDEAYLEAHPVQYVDKHSTGASPLEDTGLTAEEEEQIKAHLERLGYL